MIVFTAKIWRHKNKTKREKANAKTAGKQRLWLSFHLYLFALGGGWDKGRSKFWMRGGDGGIGGGGLGEFKCV
jgi:endo-1,4-beta-D-glucanase Y